MSTEKMNAKSKIGASLVRAGAMTEGCRIRGYFIAECFDKDGNLKWRDAFPNTVVIVGKNLMLDTAFSGAAYTVTGPYLGLISSVGYSAISDADTMTSHAGWTEAGNANAPTYTAPRKTAAFDPAAAGAIALTAALSFTITGSGTVKGGFLVYGTGASATIDSTTGVLFSAGLFTGGDRDVVNLDVLNVQYSCTL